MKLYVAGISFILKIGIQGWIFQTTPLYWNLNKSKRGEKLWGSWQSSKNKTIFSEALNWKLSKACLVPRITDYAENEHEKIDDIQVEIESCKDVFFRIQGVLVLSSHHKLSIENDVTRK